MALKIELKKGIHGVVVYNDCYRCESKILYICTEDDEVKFAKAMANSISNANIKDVSASFIGPDYDIAVEYFDWDLEEMWEAEDCLKNSVLCDVCEVVEV